MQPESLWAVLKKKIDILGPGYGCSCSSITMQYCVSIVCGFQNRAIFTWASALVV